MIIVSQDRDQVFDFDPKDLELYTEPVLNPETGTLWGINLKAGNYLLGTFDSVDEAIREIGMIHTHDADVYYVTGYYADEDGEPETLLEAVLREGTDNEEAH